VGVFLLVLIVARLALTNRNARSSAIRLQQLVREQL
jgi:sensor domain CHASE-containing protein